MCWKQSLKLMSAFPVSPEGHPAHTQFKFDGKQVGDGLQRHFSLGATVATSAAVRQQRLKLITDRNVFCSATPSAYIILSLSRGRRHFCHLFCSLGWELTKKGQRYWEPGRISDPSFKLQSAYAVYFLYATSLFAKVHTMYTWHRACEMERGGEERSNKKSKSEGICLAPERRRRRGCAVHLMQG